MTTLTEHGGQHTQATRGDGEDTSFAKDQARAQRAKKMAQGLGLFSIGLGLAEILATSSIARFTGVTAGKGRKQKSSFAARRTTFQVMGAREIAAGIAILAQPSSPRWVWARVVGDVIDLAALATAVPARGSSGARLGGSIASVAAVTALDIFTAVQLHRAHKSGAL